MFKAKAMCRTASDAHTIVVSAKSETDDKEMRFATHVPTTGECGWAEDASAANCHMREAP